MSTPLADFTDPFATPYPWDPVVPKHIIYVDMWLKLVCGSKVRQAEAFAEGMRRLPGANRKSLFFGEWGKAVGDLHDDIQQRVREKRQLIVDMLEGRRARCYGHGVWSEEIEDELFSLPEETREDYPSVIRWKGRKKPKGY